MCVSMCICVCVHVCECGVCVCMSVYCQGSGKYSVKIWIIYECDIQLGETKRVLGNKHVHHLVEVK